MKYIVLHKLIYQLSDETYHQLMECKNAFNEAKLKAELNNSDPMDAYNEYEDLCAMESYVIASCEAVSELKDNFDLHRYDLNYANIEELPF